MPTRYLCSSWQGFIQMVVYLIARGYHYYCLTLFPNDKRHKWDAIDSKLQKRYQTSISKWQRCRRKKQGTANFYYLRWNQLSLILCTEGVNGVYDAEDIFLDIRQSSLNLAISDLVSFTIKPEEKKRKTHISVRLSKKSYIGIKQSIHEVVKTRNPYLIKAEVERLNGFPCYSPVIQQKILLVDYAIRQAQKHQLQMHRSSFDIYTRLTRRAVF